MENLLTFIPENLIILIVATYVLGIFLKKLETVKDKYITIILMIFCIIFSLILTGFSSVAILQGILCWGVGVGINPTSKQLKKVE